MTNLTSVEKLKKVCLVNLNMRCWTGQTVLKDEDFSSEVPNEYKNKFTCTRGAKRLINPEHLKVFQKIRDKAQNLLRARGTLFLGSFAIPVEVYREVKPELEKLVSEFQSEIGDFLQNYDSRCEEWERTNPTFADQIRRGRLRGEEVASKMCASYSVQQVVPLDGEEQFADSAVTDIVDQLITDVTAEAKKYLRTTLQSKFTQEKGARQTGRKYLTRFAEKISALSFLKPSLVNLEKSIRDVIDRLPADGKIADSSFWLLHGMIAILADCERIRDLADGVLSVEPLIQNAEAGVSTPKKEETLFEVSTFETTSPVKEEVAVPAPTPVEASPVASTPDKVEEPEADLFDELDDFVVEVKKPTAPSVEEEVVVVEEEVASEEMEPEVLYPTQTISDVRVEYSYF